VCLGGPVMSQLDLDVAVDQAQHLENAWRLPSISYNVNYLDTAGVLLGAGFLGFGDFPFMDVSLSMEPGPRALVMEQIPPVGLPWLTPFNVSITPGQVQSFSTTIPQIASVDPTLPQITGISLDPNTAGTPSPTITLTGVNFHTSNSSAPIVKFTM